MIAQNYAKQVAVDDAFRQLHEVGVDGKVVWNVEYNAATCTSLSMPTDKRHFPRLRHR
jgi:hypothetical protein